MSQEHTAKANLRGIDAAEESTVPPVASGETYFRFMAEVARDQGFITQEGLEHVMAALYGGGR